MRNPNCKRPEEHAADEAEVALELETELTGTRAASPAEARDAMAMRF